MLLLARKKVNMVTCQHWNEYESISGMIGFCELAAFQRMLNGAELAADCCTEDMRKKCIYKMTLYHGRGCVPAFGKDPAGKLAAEAHS